MQNKDDVTQPSQVTIPGWVIAAGRFFGPVVVALAVGYASFIEVRTMSISNRDAITATNIRLLAVQELGKAMEIRLNTLEVTERNNEKAISESLARIEANLKDVKADVRELQSKAKP